MVFQNSPTFSYSLSPSARVINPYHALYVTLDTSRNCVRSVKRVLMRGLIYLNALFTQVGEMKNQHKLSKEASNLAFINARFALISKK